MSQPINAILEKPFNGQRLTDADAMALFESDDLLAIGEAANRFRFLKHPDPIVTFIIDRNINYTNVCVTDCKFCAFYRKEGESDAYVITKEAMAQKIRETQALGGNQILLQGGHNIRLKLDWYVDMIKFIKSMGIHVHGFSAPEIHFFSELNKMPVSEVIKTLRAAGWDSLPGGGAEILSENTRKQIAHKKATTDEWLGVHREAHKQGLRSTATMMFGHVETIADRVEHLKNIRNLQDETGGFTAFIDWTFQAPNTEMENVPMTSSYDYLKTTAISRLYLDNVDNIQASWVTQGPKIGQIVLQFGCNDMGSTMIEENVVRNAGANFRMNAKEIEDLVAELGYTAKKRDFFYNILN